MATFKSATTEWSPPASYKSLADRMSKEEGAAYIKRCDDWFAANPEAVPKESVETFIRSTLKVRVPTSRIFITTSHNGAMVSAWCDASTPGPIPSGCPGRVGEVVDSMNKGTGSISRPMTKWSPPLSYKFLASKMSKEKGDKYIKRCEEWFAANPVAVPKASKAADEYDTELVAKYFSRLTNVPETRALLKLWRAAGLSDERIQKSMEWHEKMDATSDERQARIDAIFGPPEEPKKTKKVAKVIKAVKKRA
jgi:hypothetical protein